MLAINCYLLVTTQLYELQNIPLLSRTDAAFACVLEAEKNNVNHFFVDILLPQQMFHSFSRQSNVVNTFECRSFVNPGWVSPQNFP